MKSRIIEIEVDETGKVKMEGHGFEGKTCEQSMKQISDALGKVTHSKTKKPTTKQNVVILK